MALVSACPGRPRERFARILSLRRRRAARDLAPARPARCRPRRSHFDRGTAFHAAKTEPAGQRLTIATRAHFRPRELLAAACVFRSASLMILSNPPCEVSRSDHARVCAELAGLVLHGACQHGASRALQHFGRRRLRSLRNAPPHWLRTEKDAAAFAEGVHCLDLESARRLDGPREEPPREGQALTGAGRRPSRRSRQQVAIIEPRPFGQRTEDPHRHIGRGGLGEGEAENAPAAPGRAAAARRAGPAHASCPIPHWPKPTPMLRIGSPHLQFASVGRDRPVDHAPSPPIDDSAAHSLTRAR